MAYIPFLNNAYFTAKVGIGTDSPGAKLEIKDGNLWLNGATGAYNPEIFFIDDAGPTGIAGAKIRYENNNGNLYFDHKWDTATSGFFFRNRVDGTPLNTMSLVNGNVGINKVDPSYKLDVEGDVRLGGTNAQNYPIKMGRDDHAVYLGGPNINTINVGWDTNSDYNLHLNYLGYQGGTTQFRNLIINDGKEGHIATFKGSSGRVGIGVASPATKLEVSSSSTSGIKVTNSGTINGEAGIEAYHTGAQVGTAYAGYITKTGAGGTNVGIYTAASGATNNYGLIVGSGNVGIGTASPTAAKLVVDSNTAPQILVKNSGGGDAKILFEDNGGLTQNASITFDQSSQNTLTIATGYVSTNDTNKIVLIPGGTAAMTLRGGDDSTNTAGSILLNGYVGTRQTGTPTYLLGTDDSGNIVKTNTVPGSGAGPYLPLAGGIMSGNIGRSAFNSGYQVGGYNNVGASHAQSNPIHVIGTSYQPGTTTLADMYGIGYTRGNASFLSFTSSSQNRGWGLYVAANGGANIFLDGEYGHITTTGNIYIGSVELSNQENTDVDTGTEVVGQVLKAVYTAAFFDFVIKKGTNIRSGTVYACHDGTNVEFTETSTNDLGDTSDVTLSVVISGTSMDLQATTTSDDWSIKSLIRAI